MEHLYITALLHDRNRLVTQLPHRHLPPVRRASNHRRPRAILRDVLRRLRIRPKRVSSAQGGA